MVEIYYSKLMSSRKEKKFNSPICPICGYKNENYMAVYDSHQLSNATNTSKKLKSRVKNILYSISPKVKEDGYWIIGLFESKICIDLFSIIQRNGKLCLLTCNRFNVHS